MNSIYKRVAIVLCRRQSMAFIILLMIAFPTMADSTEEIWWDRLDEKWCLRTESRSTCLLESFELERVADQALRFRDKSGPYQSYFVNFNTHAEGESPHKELVGETFELVTETTRNGIQILEYKVDRSKEPNLRMSIFVFKFDRRHELLLRGRSRDAVSDIADSIVAQWTDRDDR
jgi:hypothetical protein